MSIGTVITAILNIYRQRRKLLDVHCWYDFYLTRSDSPVLKRSRVEDEESGDESMSRGGLGVPSLDSIRVTQVSLLCRAVVVNTFCGK